jgi:arylsulfatase A-like enzyme
MKSIVLILALILCAPGLGRANEKPNILWIYVDDMSDWMGCYGYPLAETPNIDALARDGIRFEQAFMPSPVCSTTRSALITGAMQTTNSLHQHRTMIKEPLPDFILTVPELFRKAGYVTFNEAKEDYNFLRDRDRMYSPEFERPKGVRGHIDARHLSCLKQLKGKKFFGQLQLKGGKYEGETGAKYPMPSRVKASEVKVPPYYPDTPLIRNAIARHYEQVAVTDKLVGSIIETLKTNGLLENTAVFFFTDHGCPLPRAKQFLYEDGTKVPLIILWPAGQDRLDAKGKVRNELVNGIDISATSLALAGIKIPDDMEAEDLFADSFNGRGFVVSARDRCGIAVDRIRAIRTGEFRYIRNYQTDRALYQSQYRDKHASLIELRKLNEAGKLSPLQASYHDATQRPKEELYQLSKDPDQLVNLATNPEFQSILEKHRRHLEDWENSTDDKGRQPESRENLEAVYKTAKGKVAVPEFDFLKEQ